MKMTDSDLERTVRRVDRTIYRSAKIIQTVTVIFITVMGIVLGLMQHSVIYPIAMGLLSVAVYYILRAVYDEIGIGRAHIYTDY